MTPIKMKYVRRREFIGGMIDDNEINDKHSDSLPKGGESLSLPLREGWGAKRNRMTNG